MTTEAENISIEEEKLQKNRCKVCKESIQPAAKICPHCGSSQTPVKWAGLSKALKVVGGVTAVLSLIILATQVTNLASQSRKNWLDAIDKVEAAKIFWAVNDQNSALGLLDRAEVIYPNLKESRNLRADIGISSISRINPLATKNSGLEELSTKPDDKGIPEYMYWSTIQRNDIELFLKAVNFPESLATIAEESTGSKRGRALAYLAWVELILNTATLNPGSEFNIDIDAIFNIAIKASKDDEIVNLFRAAWLASSYRLKGKTKESERLEQSLRSFNKVLSKCTTPDIKINNLLLKRWTRALQLETLPGIEPLLVLNDMLLDGESLAINSLSLTRRYFISLSGLGSTPYPENVKKLETELLNRFKASTLVELSTQLALIHYGCPLNEGYCTGDERESGQMLFAIGRIYELAGNNSRAYEFYKRAKDNAGLSGWWASSFKSGLQRTAPPQELTK